MANLKRVLSDLKVFRREYLRNRVGLFFALIFPIILIVLFGAIFSNGNSGPINVYYQNHDNGQISTSFLTALNQTKVIQVIQVNPSVNFTQYLLGNSYSQGMIIPVNFTSSYIAGQLINVTMYTNPTDSSSGIVLSVVSGVINSFNLGHAHAAPVIQLNSQSIKPQSYKYIDFLVPGLIGFSILTSPMFSMVNISAEYKKNKIFRQLSLTPLTKGEWLTSKIIWYIILSVASFFLMTLFGIELFGAHVTFSLWIAPFLIVGPIFFVALGMLVGTVTKSQESAGVIGNIITFPMIFLSGTFFPVASMPTYLQNIAHVLPLFYVIDGLNDVMIYDNYTKALTDMLVLVVIALIVFIAAVRVFKWRED
ncbi:MAG: ABC transporter permease [archaeon]|nr:ABC transporter permease [archaeon]